MIYSLVHGDIPAAVAFNAVGVVALVLVGWSYVVWTLRRTRVTDLPRWETWRWSPHIVLAVVLVWAVVRNIPVAPFDSLRV